MCKGIYGCPPELFERLPELLGPHGVAVKTVWADPGASEWEFVLRRGRGAVLLYGGCTEGRWGFVMQCRGLVPWSAHDRLYWRVLRALRAHGAGDYDGDDELRAS